ncbi:hypothetical protein NP493_2183g00007 [Ridgeia piscesae]|uniref:Uncharacterized protein n=1 Tax=Ridgeia piscesae TaxID=27915 RepID=A0AAD9JJQ1_RIDPI|nr:hypothetical protein NP493_2183g00007 [Ridgeia piscesae]
MFCHLLFSHCSTCHKKPQNKSTYNWHITQCSGCNFV